MLGRPERCQLSRALLWEYNYKRLKLAQRLDQLGGFLTLVPEDSSDCQMSTPSMPWTLPVLGSVQSSVRSTPASLVIGFGRIIVSDIEVGEVSNRFENLV